MSKITKPMTYAVLLFVVLTFVFLIKDYGDELLDNDKASLSNNSVTYINRLSGVTEDGKNKTLGLETDFYKDTLDNPSSQDEADNKNDFSLDFNFGRKKVNTVSGFLYTVASIPEVILGDILDLPIPTWFIDILDWFWRFAIFIAIYYLIRGIGQ